jgi:tetratricopeptide (TPR) repeat protein
MLLLWFVPAWGQLAPTQVLLPDREDAGGAEVIPQGEAPPAPLQGALAMLAYEARAVPDPGFDPVERAWFAAAGSLEDRVKRTLDAALDAGKPSLEALARALLLDESLGNPLERAEAAVLLAPDLPAARIALGQALWSEERDLLGALAQVRQAARVSSRHLEASLWLRAAISHCLFTACLIGGLLFLFVAGGSRVLAAARLLGQLPGALPLVSRVALVAGLLLLPAVLGEGLFGVALAFAVLGLWPGSSWQRAAVGVALVVSIVGLHPLADRAGEELVALGSDPVAEAAFAVERGQPAQIDIDRLERAAPGDPLVARALALHAKRSGYLEDAERRYTALIEESGASSPSLLNNAANVQLALDRTEEAIGLYEAAAQSGHLVVVLFNLSQAYGRLIQLDQQDLALAEAQVIDPDALAALTDLYGSSRGTMVVDLPVSTETVRVRLGDPAAARLAAMALRSRVTPGWLGRSLMHSAAGVALVVLLASGIALVARRVKDGGEGGDRNAGIARFLTGQEAADPFLRMVRLTALRERQARIDKIKFLLSAIVPGAAGIVSRHPILGLLGTMLFGLVLASWWAQEGVGADPLAVGGGASILFTAMAVASTLGYAAVIALTIALWERS